jgi:hypothetical protein
MMHVKPWLDKPGAGFVILRESVVASGRKLRTHRSREILKQVAVARELGQWACGVDPAWRFDPPFTELVRKVGLPQ